MKAHIDTKGCIGCTLCASICPEVFEMAENGKAKVSCESIPQNCEKSAKDCEESCPVSVIKVE